MFVKGYTRIFGYFLAQNLSWNRILIVLEIYIDCRVFPYLQFWRNTSPFKTRRQRFLLNYWWMVTIRLERIQILSSFREMVRDVNLHNNSKVSQKAVEFASAGFEVRGRIFPRNRKGQETNRYQGGKVEILAGSSSRHGIVPSARRSKRWSMSHRNRMSLGC